MKREKTLEAEVESAEFVVDIRKAGGAYFATSVPRGLRVLVQPGEYQMIDATYKGEQMYWKRPRVKE